MQPQSTAQRQTREIKARYLTAGMTVVNDGELGKPATVTAANRQADDTVLVYFDGVPAATSYYVEEGVTVVEQPATAPELAFAGFAPGENRELLADVHRWARTNGWTWHECWGWVNAPYASEADLAVEWDNERPGVLTIRTGPVVFRPKHYDVDSVRQAVDQLVTLGILPDRFATSYDLGVAAGLDMAAEAVAR